MEDVYFSIGTNLGDRRANIVKALELMDEAFGVHYEALSGFVETPAWGFDGPAFLNAAVLYRLEMDPLDVLDVCKEIERSMGRTDAPEYSADGGRVYHDRVIDIDILLFGERKIESRHLTVPHPLMERRPFVMGPLNEILKKSIKK